MTRRRIDSLALMIVLGGALLLAAGFEVRTLERPEKSMSERLAALASCVLSGQVVDLPAATAGIDAALGNCASLAPEPVWTDPVREPWMTAC
jgi:hypothetical protein